MTTDEEARRALRAWEEAPDEGALRRLIALRLRATGSGDGAGVARSLLPLGVVDVVLEGVGMGEHKVSTKRTYTFRFIEVETGARYRAIHTDGFYAYQFRDAVHQITGRLAVWNPKMIAREGGTWNDLGTSVVVGDKVVRMPYAAVPLHDEVNADDVTPFADIDWSGLRGLLLRAKTFDIYNVPSAPDRRAFLRTRYERILTWTT